MTLDRAQSGTRAPIAVVMISRNEAHNMEAVLENISSFAQEIFLVDSISTDATVDIALRYGVQVVQRRFRGFGDQWNFALENLPITAPWTMKLDPDERLTDELKTSILKSLRADQADGFTMTRRLWFMGRPIGVRQNILRIWRTGACRFSNVLVNEYPVVSGRIHHLNGALQHKDSPNLHHWLEKQNVYTTAEAFSSWREDQLSASPNLLGSRLSRRMWLKKNFHFVPLRFFLMTFYCYIIEGAWRAGRVGWIWSRLRGDVYRLQSYKLREMRRNGAGYRGAAEISGKPDSRVRLFEWSETP